MIKKNFILCQELQDFINGYVMGDGYINPQGILTVDQGEKQKKFVEWLHQKLKPILTESCTIQEVIRERNGKKTRSYRFNTRSVLQDFYTNWYKTDPQNPSDPVKKKQLPTNISDLFTPLFIIVWFACDGTKTIGSKGAKFEVTALSADERHLLKELFNLKYSIKANIIRSGLSKTGTEQWALVINSPEYDKFRDLITQNDLIQTIFPYKLHPK
jgi:hypothetical protein